MDRHFTTPMMKQYERIKKQYQDCLLLYRMGDFYELFLEDAHIGAKVLDITLTSRAKGRDGRIPMAGVPYHAIDSYLAKLVKAGHRVAICEQMTEPNARGIIEREVVRVVTPGTILDEKALTKNEHNFLISLACNDKKIGIAACDISTGYFETFERDYTNLTQVIRDEIGRITPSECVISEDSYNTPEILKSLRAEHEVNITCYSSWNTYALQAKKMIKNHFHVSTLASFGLEGKELAQQAAAVLLGYLKETQKDNIEHIQTLITTEGNDYLQMDRSTIINLELFSTIREHDTKGTLLSIIDQTQTAMGGRLLKTWMRKPLLQETLVRNRHEGVEEFVRKAALRQDFRQSLEHVADIERMLSRLAVGIGNARDVVFLKLSLRAILTIKQLLNETTSPMLREQEHHIVESLAELVELINQTILDEPAISVKEGGMIKPGVHTELDTLRSLVGGGKEWIAFLEIEERKKTGIGSLKVRYNKIFGFYIEVSRANTHLVPTNYERKQTLVNGERYITPELKKQEEIILTAQEKIDTLEYEIFITLVQKILTKTHDIQQAALAIATTDCLVSFAEIAQKNQYVRPTLLNSGELNLVQGRHPVVEELLEETQFVPNDILLDQHQQQLLLITGPNMAGKSVLIRQVALIVLLCQMGSFVPAKQASISLVDRIFVRSGASDVITSGLSTFMVEMVETAYILRHATKQSLIIMDEIGRGTSTYDGISIAWAVAEYLVTQKNISAKTLFATHYHELQELESTYRNKIKNYHMAVIEEQGIPTFLHTLRPGGASASFGVAVAKLAGVPETVITNAQTILASLESRKHTIGTANNTEHAPPQKGQDVSSFILNNIKHLDLHRMTPLEALNILSKLQETVKDHENHSVIA